MRIFCLSQSLLFASTLVAVNAMAQSNGRVGFIHSAIAAAKPGDTIVIPSGVYRESNILIEKPLTILGKGNPVIDGEKKNEILLVKSDGVTIEGLTIRNGGYSSYNDIAAIRVVNANGVKLSLIHI